LEALLAALDTRDTETEGHSERVAAYTMLIAQRLNLSEEELPHIERGALLHDIGKIGVPDHILYKPGPLTPDEWEIMKQHPVVGYKMCMKIEMLRPAAPIVLHHHERWDGKGYPYGLSGEEIPLGARIFAIADTLDAMTSDRPYRKALSFAQAREEIERCAGAQFDPELVKVFLSVPEEELRAIRALTISNREARAA
jgi:putative nucleotidyltransferase with HDIG domain